MSGGDAFWAFEWMMVVCICVNVKWTMRHVFLDLEARLEKFSLVEKSRIEYVNLWDASEAETRPGRPHFYFELMFWLYLDFPYFLSSRPSLFDLDNIISDTVRYCDVCNLYGLKLWLIMIRVTDGSSALIADAIQLFTAWPRGLLVGHPVHFWE